MPEGPEIRRAADLLDAAIRAKPLKKVWFKFAHLKVHEDVLSNSLITGFETHGKALLTHFACGLSIYSHNQLYGVWKIAKSGRTPKTTRDLRLSIQGEKGAVFLFSASDISVWPTEKLIEHPFLCKLGPDALNPNLSAAALAKRLSTPRFSGKALAALLLDQTFLAGMGNYLRTEVLFYAGLHPSWRVKDLTELERDRLAEQLLCVTQRSYKTGGVTNEAAISGVLQNDGAPYEGYRFAAFERDGKSCYLCGAKITRCELAGRRIYVCPECQPLPNHVAG
jgi:endonuclease VIII